MHRTTGDQVCAVHLGCLLLLVTDRYVVVEELPKRALTEVDPLKRSHCMLYSTIQAGGRTIDSYSYVGAVWE